MPEIDEETLRQVRRAYSKMTIFVQHRCDAPMGGEHCSPESPRCGVWDAIEGMRAVIGDWWQDDPELSRVMAELKPIA